MENLNILLPAFVAGLLVASTHVPLGLEVLRRGIIFIDLAVAQIAGLGVVITKIAFHEDHNLITQLLAFLFALSAAYGFILTEKYLPKLQEAIIGSSFIVASSLALLLLANHPHGGEEVEAMLAGQILWVSWQQIIITAIVYIPLLVLWFTNRINQHYFYFIFAIAITISVQLVGVYLVFANLILPALGAVRYPQKLKAGYAIAFFALLLGLCLSLFTDLPTGPMLVCTLVIASLLWTVSKSSKRLRGSRIKG